MYQKPMRSDELYHFGILGMKWGIRRYQNDDGSLTSAGKARYGSSGHSTSYGSASKETTMRSDGRRNRGSGLSKVSAAFERTIKQGKGKENTSPAESFAKDARNSAQSSSSALRKLSKFKNDRQSKYDELNSQIAKMSDQELRSRINRIKMETEYRNLNKSTIKTGYEKAADVLDVVGDVAAVGVSVAGIAAVLAGLKK